MIKKTIALSLAAAAITGTAVFGTKHIFAADTQVSDPMSGLIQKLVQKFNLNESEVKAVFETDRSERQAARQAEMKQQNETRLTEAVTKGEITEAQKQLILQKQTEIETTRQANRPTDFKNMTETEREAEKTKREAERTELEAWAKTNGVDVKYLFGFGGGHGMGGHDGPPPEAK